MKARCSRIIALALVITTCAARAATSPDPAIPDSARKTLEWWRDARFGMFVHWGPVSLKGTEIGWSRGAEIPIEEYDNLYRHFNPTNFSARQWARTAKAAGMKYLVFTSKHHDGFCMWNTQQTDFNIMRSPFGRDVIKELAAACKREGIRFGTYHSVCDWHHPDFPLTSPGGKTVRPSSNLDRYEEYLRAQVKELITGYGPLLVMWFDVPQRFDTQRGLALEQFTRSLQPSILINNRSGAQGDYDTPEQRVGKYQDHRPWETCMTICQQWAWKPNDQMKSLKQCLQTLVLCAGGDGNLLFNVGPTPDGRIEDRQIERLVQMGFWLEKYGQTIYDTRGGPWKPTKNFASTRRGNSIFLHVFNWDGDELKLPALAAKVKRAKMLTDGKAEVRAEGNEWIVRVPKMYQKAIDTIIRLDLDRSAMSLPATNFPSLFQARASNVYQHMDTYEAQAAFDQDPHSRWATDGGTQRAWITYDFLSPKQIRGVRISEAIEARVQKFEFQCRDGTDWKTVFSGTTIGPRFVKEFEPVTAREVRLNILNATEGPTIWEIEVLTQ